MLPVPHTIFIGSISYYLFCLQGGIIRRQLTFGEINKIPNPTQWAEVQFSIHFLQLLLSFPWWCNSDHTRIFANLFFLVFSYLFGVFFFWECFIGPYHRGERHSQLGKGLFFHRIEPYIEQPCLYMQFLYAVSVFPRTAS